jgi:hypothetical protein
MIRCWVALTLAAHAAAAAPPARPLAVVNAALHQFEDGPSLSPAFTFQAGDTVFVSFQVSGYRVSEQDRTRLSYFIEARDARDLLLAPPVSRKIEAELAEEDKNWMPKARYEVLVPPLADSGRYRIRIRLKDELSGSEASQDLEFAVRGFPVEPSPTLVVRNFRFLRSEEDEKPLAVAAYRPGDAVWARFEITGYKLADKNRLDVAYGVSLLRASGEVLFAAPEAASDAEDSFYPKRYVPGSLSLNLDRDIAPGEYTIVVAVRDRVGGQQYEEHRTFRVE